VFVLTGVAVHHELAEGIAQHAHGRLARAATRRRRTR
jgi:hypothetical protein